ncbi:MAG: c-type cytochrome [Deltaproteobacteria bacterium]|nr:c-type cytochrome [Deltaproteobacteria bacterium]
MHPLSRKQVLIVAGLSLFGSLLGANPSGGVYGDIVFERSVAKEKEVAEGPLEQRVPPALFPHWVHRIRYRCMACHPTLFEMEKGANAVTMAEMKKGLFCGKCHNGTLAFSPELQTCYRCHVVPKEPAEPEQPLDPEAAAQAGKVVYDKWCATCHGPDGKGDGPAAPFLVPRPRNFSNGLFKIRTTQSGELPLDEDVFNVIMRGMPGSSMPGWRDLLTPAEVKETVVHLKTFIDEDVLEAWPPETVEIGDPVPLTPERLAKGKELYTKMKCWECHGEEGRGDGPSAPKLKDDWGFPIAPANLTEGWTFRGGSTAKDIYRTFTTGMNGTPMPSYLDVINDEDRWSLAYFVKTLSPERKPKPKTFFELKAAQP